MTRDVRLTFTHGLLVVPGVPEDFARGDYNSWIETGVSSYVHHAHLGLVLKNQYIFRLHYAASYGTDERTYLKTFLNTAPADGQWNTYLAEARWQADPWGQLGFTGGRLRFQTRRIGRRRYLVGRRLDARRPRDDQQVPRTGQQRKR